MNRQVAILFIGVFLPLVAQAEMVAAKRVAAPYIAPMPSINSGIRFPANINNANCSLNETTNFTFSFNKSQFDESAASARKYLMDRVKDIDAIAKGAGITRLGIAGMNYNLSGSLSINTPIDVADLLSAPAQQDEKKELVSDGGTSNNFSGSITVRFEPADKWGDFLAALTARNIRPQVSYNAYRNNCN